MNQNSAASHLSPELLSDLEYAIEWAKKSPAILPEWGNAPYRMFIEADEELIVCEYLRDLGADVDGDSECDGPDTIRCTGPGWVLILQVI